jgi:ribosomal 50S subunit-recycling heat shock protein
MRLDKFLKLSRIIKRRTVANEACDSSYVSVNGKTAKASYDVKIGDVIEIQYGNKTTKFVVNMIKDHVTKDEASEMYSVIK